MIRLFSTPAFKGTSLFVYGNLIYDHGRYQVKLDDDDPLLLTGKSSYSFYEGLLFFAGGLDPVAEHRLNFTNYDLKHFGVVYTVVRSDPISGDPSSASSSTGHAPTSSEGAAKGRRVFFEIAAAAIPRIDLEFPVAFNLHPSLVARLVAPSPSARL